MSSRSVHPTKYVAVVVVAAAVFIFLTGVTDRSASAAMRLTTASGASLELLEESSRAITYTGDWRRMTGGDSGGSSNYLNSAGRATLTFHGTGVAWVTRTTPNSGIARVWLDGKMVGRVDRYSASSLYQQVVYSVSGLSLGTHTIAIEWTGTKNAASAGTNLMLDAFRVTTGRPRPGLVTVSPLAVGHSVSWAPVQGVLVEGYRVVRTNSAGTKTVVATTGPTATLVRDETSQVGASYTYQIEPILGAESRGAADPSEPAAAPTGDAITKAITASAECPAATTSVATAAELTRALDSATAGTVISLAAGTYVGQFKLRNIDGGSKRVWICGPAEAVLTSGSTATGSALMITSAARVTVRGITLENSLKGVSVITSSDVVLRDLTINRIGYEAVHFRTQTVDSYLIGSKISRVGVEAAKYGEGVYVGTSSANVCAQNDCLPDRTNRIHVIDNTIWDTGAQAIEAKEGTVVGTISGNRVAQSDWMDPASTAVILVKGNQWLTDNNIVTVKGGYGLANIFSSDGSGNDNDFAGNQIDGPAQYGIWVHSAIWTTSGPTLLCSNTASGRNVALSNVACIP